MQSISLFTGLNPSSPNKKQSRSFAQKSIVSEMLGKKPKKRNSFTQRSAAQTKSEYMLSQLNADRIARRIARGQKVSSSEKKYLEQTDAKKATDASVANNRRKGV